jgi:hypothetical protein
METGNGRRRGLLSAIRERQVKGEVAEFSLDDAGKVVQLRTVGKVAWVEALAEEYEVRVNAREEQKQVYSFLARELRPGSGLIRYFGGVPEGPGGTVTCLLSSRDGHDLYLVAAGHVISKYWEDMEGEGSTYWYGKGFPATNSRRSLGKAFLVSPKPDPIDPRYPGKATFVDVGIVRLDGSFTWKQRTTCYGSFGEVECERSSFQGIRQRAKERLSKGVGDQCMQRQPGYGLVIKCGAEEPHGTEAWVECLSADPTIFGLGGEVYELKDQIIVKNVQDTSCGVPTPFAVPGDSGSMVVCKHTREPVGMLIAGSVLDGRYVVTPFEAIQKVWRTEGDLVMLRA